MNENTTTADNLSAKFRILQVILFFLLVPAALLGALPHLGVLPAPPEMPELVLPLREIFFGLAFIDVILGCFLQKILFKKIRSADQSFDVDATFKSFMTSKIVSFAFFESISIFGFVLFMLTQDLNASTLLTFVSIAAMLFNWPRENGFRGVVGLKSR